MKCDLKDKPLLWDHFKSLYLFNNLSYTNFFLWKPLPSKSICCWHMCWWSLYLQSSFFVDICVDGLSAFKVHILLTYVLIVSAFKVHMCWWSLCLQSQYVVDICVDGLYLQSSYFVDICVDGLSAFKGHILLTYVLMVPLPSKYIFCWHVLMVSLPSKTISCWQMARMSLCLQRHCMLEYFFCSKKWLPCCHIPPIF